MTTLERTTEIAALRLESELLALGRVVVAFSGGVDSSLLASAALRTLGPESMLAVTADSDSLAEGELERCRDLATEWEMPWRPVLTEEMANPKYVANDADRCYWCKDALMDATIPVAKEMGATVTLGVNIDDLGEHRPGQKAAQERGARFPLVDAGFTKADVRGLAHHWGLPIWDRPAMPCLASRIPYGTSVSVNVLSKIDRAEQALRNLGFNDLRVRHYEATARIELRSEELRRAVEIHDEVVAALKSVGYDYVTLDLEGLRSGNLNSAIGM
ncbi:MAG: ATP-dependent sacrificial sulfur transferase LarE [Acidimicrobiia bacterium]